MGKRIIRNTFRGKPECEIDTLTVRPTISRFYDFKILRNTFRGKPECETGASGVGRQLQALLLKIRIRIGIWVKIRIKIKISIWNWIWIGFNIQWLLFITKMLFGI